VDSPDDVRRIAFAAVSAAFGSLGRVCMALDAQLRVLHVSDHLDGLLGEGSAERLRGRPIEQLLGAELFGPGGSLRQALAQGERREGWRASLRVEPNGSRVVSVTVAPLVHAPGTCDDEARYIVVLRPAAEDETARGAAPVAFAGLIARSPAMLHVLRLVENLQHSDATVLLSGESGTGKGLLAQAIHAHSPRRDRPFVVVNCGALPEALLESELFGHVRGAFTGAFRDRTGRFEAAEGGTILLDEVGEVPLHLQVKLLRVLQERAYERVGDSRTVAADVRIIAATHRDLRRAVERGQFREDLLYRLRVFPIDLPPLRDRREDVEPIARYLLGRVGARHGRALRFSPESLRALLAHPWPGNVRELENALEYAVTVARGQTLQPEDLPPEVLGAVPAPPEAPSPGAGPAPDGERDRILAQLEVTHWRITHAAEALGMSRSTLWRKMRELGLHR